MSSRIDEEAPKPDFYLGNYPSDVTGFEYAQGLAKLAIGIVDTLATPKQGYWPKTLNGRAYTSPYQAQIIRLSASKRMPLKSGIIKEITDEVAILMGHPASGSIATKLHITRQAYEHRASLDLLCRSTAECFTNIDFYADPEDESTCVELGICHETSQAVLMVGMAADERITTVLNPKEKDDKAITMADIENMYGGIAAGMGRAVVFAETIASNRLTRDFDASNRLSDQRAFSPRKDPHKISGGIEDVAFDLLVSALIAKQSDGQTAGV